MHRLWVRTVNLSAYVGTTVTLQRTGTQDASLAMSFFIDETALRII